MIYNMKNDHWMDFVFLAIFRFIGLLIFDTIVLVFIVISQRLFTSSIDKNTILYLYILIAIILPSVSFVYTAVNNITFLTFEEKYTVILFLKQNFFDKIKNLHNKIINFSFLYFYNIFLVIFIISLIIFLLNPIFFLILPLSYGISFIFPRILAKKSILEYLVSIYLIIMGKTPAELNMVRKGSYREEENENENEKINLLDIINIRYLSNHWKNNIREANVYYTEINKSWTALSLLISIVLFSTIITIIKIDFGDSILLFLLIYFIIGLPSVVVIESLKKLTNLFCQGDIKLNSVNDELIDSLIPIIGESDINKANYGLFVIILINLLHTITNIMAVLIVAYIVYIILHGIFSGLNGIVIKIIHTNIIKYVNISADRIEKIVIENNLKSIQDNHEILDEF